MCWKKVGLAVTQRKMPPLSFLDECGHMGSFPVSIASAFCRQKLKMLLQTLCADMKEREVSLMKLIFTLIDSSGGGMFIVFSSA